MLRSFAALGSSTVIRLLTGFALFVLMARHWGAAAFGEFMYLFSLAALLALICEYGFSQQILRDIGRHPEQAAERMSELFSAKLWLTVLAILVAALTAIVASLTWRQSAIFALLLLAGILMSYGDFLMSCFRALGHYDREAVITFKGNTLYFVLAVAALYLLNDVMWVALAFVIGRVGHLGLTLSDFQKKLSSRLRASRGVRDAWTTIQRGFAYGADVAVATAFVSLDTLLVTHTLGFESTGIYQAAARFYQGAALLPPIFAGVFLPKLARVVEAKAQFSKLASKLYWAMLASGTLLCAAFIFGAPLLQRIYPEAAMASASALLPWFGILVLARFIAAAQGISITALGGQRARMLLFSVALVIMASTAVPFMLRLGLAGMVLACTAAYLFLTLSFCAWTEKQGLQARASIGISILATTLSFIYVAKF